MQHKNGILAIAVLLGVFSCTHREDDGIQKVKFQAVQADGPSTKTVLQADGSVFWSPGDAVSLFYGGATIQKTKLTAENTSAAAQTTFSGVLDGFLPDVSTSFWAVYPYAAETAFDGSAVTVTVPAEQTAVAGTFASDAFVSISTSKDYTLQFYNLCGGIKFSVANQGITSVIFKGNSDEILAGQVHAAFDENGKPVVTEVVKGTMELVLNAPEGGFEVGKWYYMVALPTTLSAGYTMTFLDAAGGLVAERVTDTSIAIKRAVWGRLIKADNVGPEEGSIIYYTSTDGNIVSPNDGASFGEGVTLVSNTYENGQGVMQFSGLVTMIGENALRNYGTGATATLKTIVLPETCVAIGEFAFGAQVHLEDVQFPESLRVINLGAFAVCSSLPGIVFPENLEEIYHFAFSNCQKLTAVTIPQSVQLLEGGVFTNCISMEHFYGKFAADSGHALIDGETLLAVAVAGLDSYTVPDGVTAIADYAILNYPNLSEIVLPDGLLSVGNRSICGTDVTNLTIPKSVISLGEEAFAGNTFLESITIEAVMPPAGATAMFDDTNDCPIYVPDQSVSVYKAAEYWSTYADRIQPIRGGSTITASKYLTFTSEGITTLSLENNGGNAPVLYYSTDTQNWTLWDYSELTFSTNAPLYICGDNPDGFSRSTNNYSRFVTSLDFFSVSGDIMSLLDMETDLTEIPSDYCFYWLFFNNYYLVTGPSLPATTLSKGCYESMFGVCGHLTTAPELPATILASGCYLGMFSECTSLTTAPKLPATTLSEGCYRGMFSGCSNLITVSELPATTLADYCYSSMFYGCTGLTEAPELPATSLANYCYYYMFYGCSSITTAPSLPATTLSDICYSWMFYGCTSLTKAPDLPATTLAEDCYKQMFFSCTNLEEAPDLPASTLALRCYRGMFEGCTSLTTAPELSATTLSEECYYGMFSGCTSLNTAPELPATTLTRYCYSDMFEGCTSLTTAPKLPAITLAESCYSSMFYNCISLTDAPELPAISMADYCYSSMFWGCTGLTEAPELPATSLADYCYSHMFYGCSSLTDAPKLLASTLPSFCYYFMFSGCSSLDKVICLATDISSMGCTSLWLSGVSDTGTFVKAAAMHGWTVGGDGIPEGWDVKEDINASKYLTFTSEGTTKIALHNEGGNAPKLYYSDDAENWAQWDYSELEFTGDSPLYICGFNPDGMNANGDKYSVFTSSGSHYAVSGDIMSLLDGNNDLLTIPSESCFLSLFKNCEGLTSAPALPATTLSFGCYASMFSGCTSLTVAPELPATTLAECCYAEMFFGCSNLMEAPELPATIAVDGCYASMFTNCTSLKEAPILPATVLGIECYLDMFSGCTALTQVPELPAITLAESCYTGMFSGCTALTEAPELPAIYIADCCYYAMFWGCENLNTPPQLPAKVLAPGCYLAMFVGCTSLVSAPGLPATSLAESCYSQMFFACDNLSSPPELPATTLKEKCYYGMFTACYRLTEAPALPATELADSCYVNMFAQCKLLTSAPELPATTLTEGCYAGMFTGCFLLSFVKCLATDISASGCLNGWLEGVAENGTFVKAPGMDNWPIGTSGIPNGWMTVNNGDAPIGGVEGFDDDEWD